MRFFPIIFFLSILSCKDPTPVKAGIGEGRALGEALQVHLEREKNASASPFRCMRITSKKKTSITIPQMMASVKDDILELESFKKVSTLRISVVSDARGNTPEALHAISLLRVKFKKSKIQVLLSLGGLAQEEEAILSVLGALTKDAPYLTIAMPGDRESLVAHRKAIQELVARGLKIVDGSRFQQIRLGRQLLILVPGTSKTSNLVAGSNGCQYTNSDLQSLAQRLTTLLANEDEKNTRVMIASYAPARTMAGSDKGDAILTPFIEAVKPFLSVYGMLGSPPIVNLKTIERQDTLFANSIDPYEGTNSALLLTFEKKRIQAKHL